MLVAKHWKMRLKCVLRVLKPVALKSGHHYTWHCMQTFYKTPMQSYLCHYCQWGESTADNTGGDVWLWFALCFFSEQKLCETGRWIFPIPFYCFCVCALTCLYMYIPRSPYISLPSQTELLLFHYTLTHLARRAWCAILESHGLVPL